MKIYIAHSRSFNFEEEIYAPIKASRLNNKHTFIFPHENSKDYFDSKEYFKNEAELLIADVSYPSIGLGIELGWADLYNIPIVCIYKKGSNISDSLKAVTENFIEYSDNNDLIDKIEEII